MREPDPSAFERNGENEHLLQSSRNGVIGLDYSVPRQTLSEKYDHNEFNISYSVIPKIWVSVFLYTLWAIFWTTLFMLLDFKSITVNPLIITLLSVVVGLLLVFRTNTAYDRYWEARRLWGTISTHSRNLARTFWIGIMEKIPDHHREKLGAMNLILAFSIAVKHHLRNETGTKYRDIHQLLVHIPGFETENEQHEFENIPIEISLLLGCYIQRARELDLTDVPTTNSMIAALTGLMDTFSNLERIRTTPLPKAYTIHLQHTLLIYLSTLPFQLLGGSAQMNWMTIPVIFMSSFTLLGIQGIAEEIENVNFIFN
jgi:putative membrane protein